MSDRDKFLAEAMGWIDVRIKRGAIYGTQPGGSSNTLLGDVNSWETFGKLWEWSQEQEWWMQFLIEEIGPHLDPVNFQMIICPDRFADAVYDFLNREVDDEP